MSEFAEAAWVVALLAVLVWVILGALVCVVKRGVLAALREHEPNKGRDK